MPFGKGFPPETGGPITPLAARGLGGGGGDEYCFVDFTDSGQCILMMVKIISEALITIKGYTQ